MSTTPIQLPALEPPKYYSPFDARAKLMNLQNLAQQQQIGQQQLQVGQMSIEDHQRALAQTQAINEAHKNAWTIGADGKPQFDKGKFTEALVLSNHGSAIPGIMEGYTKYEKSLADLGKVKGEVAAAEQNAAGAFGAAAQSADNDPHVFLNLMKSAVHNEALTEDHVKPFVDDVTAALGYDPSGQVARGLVKKYTDLMIAGSPKQQELATAKRTSESTVTRNTAQGKLADVNSLQKRMEIAAQTMPPADPQTGIIDPQKYTEWRSGLDADVQAKTPPALSSPVAAAILKRNLGLTVEQQRLADQAKAALEEKKKVDAANMGNTDTELRVIATNPNETPERRAAAKAALKLGLEEKIASRPVTTVQIPGLGGPGGGAASELTGEEYLNTLPKGTASQIRSVTEGRDPMPPATSRQASAIALRDAVYKFDPTFSVQRAQIRKAFTTGPDGRNIGNLNTATVHLDQLYDAAMAMKNGSFQPGNEAWNRLSTIFGSSMPTNFDALKVTVSGEMANALKGVATDPEIAHINETLSRAKSPEQLAGVVDEDLQSIAGKMNTYHERAQQQDVGKWSPVLPSARAVFQRHGIDPDTLKKTGAGTGGGAGPAGTIGVPLKSGRTAYMAPDAAAKFKRDHPELVK